MNNEAKLQQTVKAVSPAPKKKRRSASLDKRKARGGWLFVMPFVIGFALIYLPVIFDSLKLSFYRLSVQQGGGFIYTFVGWQNYSEALFVNPNFVRTLTEGIWQLLSDIPAIVIFSLFMAVLLNQNMFGRAAFRAIFFIPVILSTGIIEKIDLQNTMVEYMGEDGGIVDGSGQSATEDLVSMMDVARLFNNMRIGNGLLEYVTTMINNIFSIVNRSGVQMLIFLAGLQSISPAIYESCQIEGASAWETFWKITFPMISPMILVNAVYTIIDSFTRKSNTVMSFISTTYESANGNVISTAMAWMYFLIVILIIAAVAGIMSAYVFYQKRD